MHAFLLFPIVAFFSSTAFAATNVEFVVDLSGSMRQTIGNETRLESAMKALDGALAEVPEDGAVAVRVYGHRVEQTKKDESCRDTELVVPFGTVDRAAIMSKLRGLSAKGYTPIAHSLEETRNDLYDASVNKEAERMVVLLSDGEETCGGDPVGVLRKLRDEGFKLKVFAVGFGVEEVARKQLKEIAEFSGGKYFDANDSVQLQQVLKEATKESLAAAVVHKEKATYGTGVRGGDSFETAVPVELNKELRLDHHQKIKDFDYFRIDLKAGDELRIVITTLEKGLYDLAKGKPQENDRPYMGVAVVNSQRKEIGNKELIGARFGREELVITAEDSGTHYILIGSSYADIHKDHATFTVTTTARGDLGTNDDAGEAIEAAMKIDAQKYAKNYIGGFDNVDLFQIDGKKGEELFFGVVPNVADSGIFYLRLFDEFKQVIGKAQSEYNAGVKFPVKVPEDGIYYFEVKNDVTKFLEYSLIVRRTAPASGTVEGGPPAQ